MERYTALLRGPWGTKQETVNAGGVPAAWIWSPQAQHDRAILYLHGGGYIAGSIRTHRALAAYLSKAAQAPVLLLEYRRAPEHPFPAALDDACAAYRWLLVSDVSPGRLAIAGDSAGGGLAIAVLLKLRDRGLTLPAAGVCLSPWLDLALTGTSLVTKARVDPILKTADLCFMVSQYLGGTEIDVRTPMVSPLYGELYGLPRLLIHVGSDEILLDDAIRFYQRAREAGVDAQIEVWDGMMHVWHMGVGLIPEASKAIERIGRFLRSTWDTYTI